MACDLLAERKDLKQLIFKCCSLSHIISSVFFIFLTETFWFALWHTVVFTVRTNVSGKLHFITLYSVLTSDILIFFDNFHETFCELSVASWATFQTQWKNVTTIKFASCGKDSLKYKLFKTEISLQHLEAKSKNSPIIKLPSVIVSCFCHLLNSN